MQPCENFRKQRRAKKVVLEKDFGGVKAGRTLFIGTPQLIAEYIQAIPPGETVSIVKLRNQIARRNRCDAMCPVSTAIFLRIVADFAIDEMSNGKRPADVVPFWRAIGPDDKVAKKLSLGPDWIAHQRSLEAAGDY